MASDETRDWVVTRARGFLSGHTETQADPSIPWQVSVERLLQQIVKDEHTEACIGLREESRLDGGAKKAFISEVNREFLFQRELEWTNHGIIRTFRFWSHERKVAYLKLAGDVMESLREVTPHVSLGFGSVLAIMRDQDFIPHDDDMDIVVAFRRNNSGLDTISAALVKVEAVLIAAGFVLYGDFPTHRNVNRPRPAGLPPWVPREGATAVDVFVGLIEGEKVSWFPSVRGGLDVSDIFPTRAVDFLGVSCQIPGRPEVYLAKTYGEDWRTPVANWNHPWDITQYQDLM